MGFGVWNAIGGIFGKGMYGWLAHVWEMRRAHFLDLSWINRPWLKATKLLYVSEEEEIAKNTALVPWGRRGGKDEIDGGMEAG